MKKFLRPFLVLCLCCSIVFSAAIPQAKAFDLAGAVLYNIAGNIGVNAALRAIGVGPGNSPEAFNNLVNDIANSDIFNTASQILIYGSAGDYKGLFQKTFLQGILDFMFDSGTIVNSDGSYTSLTVSASPLGAGTYSASAPFWLVGFTVSNTTVFLMCSKETEYIRFNSNAYSLSQTFGDFYFISYVSSPSGLGDIRYLGDYTGKISYSSSTVTMARSFLSSYSSDLGSLSSTVDLTLDTVASSVDSSLYDSWTANGGTYDGGDYIPVSIPSLDASAISAQTQAQAQAGSIPDAVVEEIVAGSEAVPDTDTGTIAEVIDAIQALPQTMADLFTGIKDAVLSIPQAIADVLSPPAVSESFQISLTDFFPFCIPFDLYNLLDALAASPEAPVINGVIPVPTFGQTYEIEVDLTPWDNVAALFRTLQLGLFIVGLALVTRERFLRS